MDLIHQMKIVYARIRWSGLNIILAFMKGWKLPLLEKNLPFTSTVEAKPLAHSLGLGLVIDGSAKLKADAIILCQCQLQKTGWNHSILIALLRTPFD